MPLIFTAELYLVVFPFGAAVDMGCSADAVYFFVLRKCILTEFCANARRVQRL